MAERRAVWQIVADFFKVTKDAERLSRALGDVDRAQHKLNTTNNEANRTDSDRQRSVKELIGSVRNLNELHKDAASGSSRAAAAIRVLGGEESKLADVRRRLASATINEQRANVNLEQARSRLQRVTKSTTSSSFDLERAHLNVAQAELRVAAAHERTGRAASILAAETRKLEGSSGGIINNFKRLRSDFEGTGKAASKLASFMGLLKFPAIIIGARTLVSVLSALTGGFVALLSAVAPAAGVLATLPQAFAAAGQGVGTLFLGLVGVRNALKAYTAQQKSATKTGASSAKTEIDNARRIRDAQRALRDARESQVRAAQDGARSIAQAEENVASAQQAAIQAQKDLNAARLEAKRNIRDLQNQLQDLSLSEERASLSVEEARANLVRTLNDPGSTDLQRRDAALAVKEAEQRLKEIQQDAQDSAKSLADAQQKGVENSDVVVQAKQQQAQANKEVLTSQQELAKAVQDSSRSQRDAAEAVQSAVENLADAQAKQAAGADAASAANQAYADALKKLTPEGRAFVKQLLAMQPLLLKLRATAERNLLPGFTDALKRSVSLFPIFNRGVAETGRAIGDTASAGGKLVTSGPFKRDFGTIISTNTTLIRIFGRILLNIVDALRNVTVAAIPLTLWLGRVAEGWSKTIKAQAQAGRDSGKTAAFFEKTRLTLTKLGKIFGNLIAGLHNIGKAGFESGQSFLDTFIRLTDQFKKFTGSVQGQAKIKKFFDDIRPTLSELGKIVGVLGKGFLNLGADKATSGFLKQIREQILPALGTLSSQIQSSLGTDLLNLVTSLINVLSSLAKAGGGLETFLKIFTQFLDIIKTVLDVIPGSTIAIGLLLATMGGFKALKLASAVTGISGLTKQIVRLGEASAGEGASNLSKFTEGLKRLGSGVSAVGKGLGGRISAIGKQFARLGPLTKTGVGAAGKNVSKLGTLFRGLGSGLGDAVKLVGGGFGKMAKVVKSAMLGLRALMLANPWILVVAALIVAVILIIKYWDQIKKVVMVAVNFILDFLKKHWPLVLIILTGGLGAVVVLIIKHWETIKKVFIGAVKAIVGFLKSNWYTIVLTLLLGPLGLFIGLAIKYWRQIAGVFKTAISNIIAATKIAWGAFYNAIVNPVKSAFDWVKAEFGKFKGALSVLGQGTVTAFSKVWGGIKKAFSDPVQFIVNTVIDDWILGTMNKVLSFLHLPNIPLVPKIGQGSSAGGGGGNARAVARNTGGFIPGTGSRDTVPAMLTPGEFVIRKSAAQALGPDRLRQLNRTGRIGFEDGGNVFSNAVKAVGGAVGSGIQLVGSTVKGIGGATVDLVRTGAADGLDQLFKPIRALLNHIPDAGAFTAIPKGMAGYLMDKAVGFVRGQESSLFSKTVTDFPIGNAVGRWAPTVAQALTLLRQPVSLVSAVLELIRHESGGNPNAINLTDSNARRGDPSRGLMQTIGSTFRAYAGQFLARGIYDPLANIFAGLNYGIHRYGSVMNIPGIYSIAHGGPYRPYAVGGGVPGSGSKDTVPAMLTPGEFVIRKSAAQRIGLANLHALNSVQHFHAGGPVRGVVRKKSKGNWVNSLFLNDGSINRFPGTWDLDLDSRLSKAYPKVPPPIASADLRTLATSLNISRTRGGAGIGEIQNRYKWGLQKLLTLIGVGKQYLAAHVDYAHRGRIFGEYNSWVSKAHTWNNDLDRVLGLRQDGRFGPDDVDPLKHVLDHAFGRPHDKFAPRPWGPLDAAEVAEQEQLRANAIQQEFNGYLATFASWGLNDLVEKLYGMGPADGMEIARAAAKNRAEATSLNAAYAAANKLADPSQLDALKMIGYVSAWDGQPGLRDLARKLQAPDYAVVQLYDLVKDQLTKAVPANKLEKLINDITLFRQGLFYAEGGGQVPGTGSGDTVPAMLTPGEFVLRRKAVAALGLGNVMALNHFADGGPVGMMNSPGIPQLAASLSGIGSGGMYVQHADQISYNYDINTVINNPVGENSAASLNRNLKRQARLGVFRPGQSPNE